jgi:hypothetical protein
MAFGKREAIRTASQLGNCVAVEFTGEVVKGYTVVHNDDMHVKGTISFAGFLWEITSIQETSDLPIITLRVVEEL